MLYQVLSLYALITPRLDLQLNWHFDHGKTAEKQLKIT